jgi:small GTP-binding protein
MIQKKICMLGYFGVGKTSLVSRFVKSIFSDKYLTTVGVKIDKKIVKIGEQEVNLMLWDIQGEDEFQKVQTSYLRGASGYFLIVDGTRKHTLEKALDLRDKAEKAIGKVPFILIFNKMDLTEEWEFDDASIDELSKKGYIVFLTSAKTGKGVEEAFTTLSTKMLSGQIST